MFSWKGGAFDAVVTGVAAGAGAESGATVIRARPRGASLPPAGAAVTGVESADFATVYGSALAVLLVAAGTTPGHIAVSVVGLAGLVGFVPWGIARFFPGETRAPFIVLVVGLLVAGSGMILRWISRRGVRRFSVVSHRASGM